MLLSEESIQKIVNDQIQKIIPILQREITNEILKLIVVQEDICPKKEDILEKSSESELLVEESPTLPKKEKSRSERKKELLLMKVVDLKKIASNLGDIKGNLKKNDLVDAILKKEISQTKKDAPPKEIIPPKSKKEIPPKKKKEEKKFIVVENEFGILVDKDTGKYIIDKDTNSVFGIFSGKDKYTSLSKKEISLLEKQKIPLYHIKLNIKPLTSEEIKNKLFPEESSEEEKDTSLSESDSSDDGEESETNKKEGDEIKTIEDVFKESFGKVNPPKPTPKTTNPPKKLKKKGEVDSDSD